MKTQWLVTLGILGVVETVAATDAEPIQLSLTPDIAVYSRSATIDGLSLNIWGENP